LLMISIVPTDLAFDQHSILANVSYADSHIKVY